MSNLVTYTINFNDMEFIHGDFIKADNWGDHIFESGGIHRDSQYMAFKVNDVEVGVTFELTVSGTYSFDPGDWETAPYSECDIDDVEISITDVTIDEYEVELTKDLTDILEKIINKICNGKNLF